MEWMLMKVISLLLLVLVLVFVTLRFYGAYDWQRGTVVLRRQLSESQKPLNTKLHDRRELESLPAPVQRYFQTVLKESSPMIASAQFRHSGTFNMGETEANWQRFESDQTVITHAPGFDWDGRIRIVPGLNVHVHDAYVAGEGVLQAKLLGIFTLANMRGGQELAQGELMRYLAEAVWYPTALLPSQGVLWQAIDSNSARATFSDGDNTVSLDFHFNAEGLVDAIRTDSRPRTVAGKSINTPWLIRVWNYQFHQGLRVPAEGEVAWVLDNGTYPYWRGRIDSVSYQFAEP
jgi:hypothetical protein